MNTMHFCAADRPIEQQESDENNPQPIEWPESVSNGDVNPGIWRQSGTLIYKHTILTDML